MVTAHGNPHDHCLGRLAEWSSAAVLKIDRYAAHSGTPKRFVRKSAAAAVASGTKMHTDARAWLSNSCQASGTKYDAKSDERAGGPRAQAGCRLSGLYGYD